jgi:hypothetical protein
MQLHAKRFHSYCAEIAELLRRSSIGVKVIAPNLFKRSELLSRSTELDLKADCEGFPQEL